METQISYRIDPTVVLKERELGIGDRYRITYDFVITDELKARLHKDPNDPINVDFTINFDVKQGVYIGSDLTRLIVRG